MNSGHRGLWKWRPGGRFLWDDCINQVPVGGCKVGGCRPQVESRTVSGVHRMAIIKNVRWRRLRRPSKFMGSQHFSQ
jgi:hypothetical protein